MLSHASQVSVDDAESLILPSSAKAAGVLRVQKTTIKAGRNIV